VTNRYRIDPHVGIPALHEPDDDDAPTLELVPLSRDARRTAQLAPIEIEALLATAVTSSSHAETIAMVPLVDLEQPCELARGSDAMPPRRRR
jgi:hypothetical protein